MKIHDVYSLNIKSQFNYVENPTCSKLQFRLMELVSVLSIKFFTNQSAKVQVFICIYVSTKMQKRREDIFCANIIESETIKCKIFFTNQREKVQILPHINIEQEVVTEVDLEIDI